MAPGPCLPTVVESLSCLLHLYYRAVIVSPRHAQQEMIIAGVVVVVRDERVSKHHL